MSNVTASREGPYSLLHRPSGAIRLFATLHEAVAGLQVLGVRRLVDAASPEWLFHISNRWSALCYPPQIGLHWQLTNVYGEIVTVDARVLAPAKPSAARRRCAMRARYRVDPVPGMRMRGFSVYFRSPRTLAMLREAASRDDAEAPGPRDADRLGRSRPPQRTQLEVAAPDAVETAPARRLKARVIVNADEFVR